MTSQSKGQSCVGPTDASNADAAIAEYLKREPAFFLRNPALVSELQIPHDAGGAVSLIEHQVNSLRRACGALESQLASLVDNARSNEELARRLHQLILELLQADRLDELLTTLYQGLEQRFGADMVALRLFATPASPHNRGLAEFVGPEVRALFECLLEDMEPRCGRGDAQQLAALFAERQDDVASIAVMPIAAGPVQGVLAIASRDAGRHRTGMGTHYLRQLADVVGSLIAAKL